MTYFVCAYCGARATKADVIVSKTTGRAWCINEDACRLRKHRALREQAKRQVSDAQV